MTTDNWNYSRGHPVPTDRHFQQQFGCMCVSLSVLQGNVPNEIMTQFRLPTWPLQQGHPYDMEENLKVTLSISVKGHVQLCSR